MTVVKFRRQGPGLATVAARRRGVQDRAVLAGIEMTPTPPRLMIVRHALLAALRAVPGDVRPVSTSSWCRARSWGQKDNERFTGLGLF